jgi:integrase
LRQRGETYFYRVRIGPKEQTVNLGTDPEIAMREYKELRKRRRDPSALRSYLEQRKRRRAAENEVPAPTLTVTEAAERWLSEHVQHNRSVQNLKDARARVRRFLTPFMGETRIDRVTAATLSAYRHWLAGRKHPKTEEPLRPLTVKHVLADCRAMLNYCLNTGLIERSPVPTRGWIPRIPERAPDRFTAAERQILVRLPDPHGRVLRFLLATGLRWGEMTRAQASDITDGVLLVRRSKSGKVRRVPIPHATLEECSNRVERLCPFDLSGNFNADVRKLIADHLDPLDEAQRKPLENLKRFHVHLTRHTFASEWREAGGSLEALRRILGHSTIRVTEQYGGIADDLIIGEARRIEREKTGPKRDQTGTAAGEDPCKYGGGTGI